MIRSQRAAHSRRLAAALALTLSACGGKEAAVPGPTPAPVPVRVENAALGLAFSGLPAGMRVARNEGATLELVSTIAGVEAPVTAEVSTKQSSAINLVERAKAFQAEVIGGGGTFHGGNELVTPFGFAYTVRGTTGGAEERRVLLVHPGDSERLLTLAVRYPAGDSAATRARFEAMLELAAALEPLPAGPTVP